MIFERAWALAIFLPACVVHETGTSVAIEVEASPAVTSDRGFELRLTEAVLLVHEVHLEPCPEGGFGALLQALSPIGVAHAHGGFLGNGTEPIRAMSLLVHSAETVELHPAVGEYCGVTPLFAPGSGQPTLRIALELSGTAGAPSRTLTIVTDAWIRPELSLPTMVIDEDQPEVGVTLSIEGPTWWAGIDFDREDPAMIGALLVERLGSVLSARWEPRQ